MFSLFLSLLFLAGLAESQQAPQYTPVPYQQAPADYPGAPFNFPVASTRSKTCYVPAPADGSNAVPNITNAFRQCSTNAKIVFNATTYNISSVMQTIGLNNVEIEINGTLIWSPDVNYWTRNSYDEGYQNQSTAWILGGDHVHIYGHNSGTLNGNGDVWYREGNNSPGRPHQITFRNLTNSVVEGLRFIKSQMWSMTIMSSTNVLLQDIFINNTGSQVTHPMNTDGANTVYSNNITFARWVVDNGDDSIALKANSTNILIEDCTFYNGRGLAMGSIGQFKGQYETIVNVTARRIFQARTVFAMSAKVWTGTPINKTAYGVGGGTGLIKNVTMEHVTLVDVGQYISPNNGTMFAVTQCYGLTGDCDSSTLQIENIGMRDVSGTLGANVTEANIHCPHATPCFGIELTDISLKSVGVPDSIIYCGNVANTTGFTCPK